MSDTDRGRPPDAGLRHQPVVLCSRAAYDQWWPLVAGAVPAARALVAEPDGSLTGDGDATVALLTLDAWDDAGAHLLEHIASASRLELLQTVASGTDGEPYESLRRRGVAVHGSSANSAGVADFVLRGVLDALQDGQRWRDAAARRSWERHRFREVFLTRWLLVGLGAIGSAVARRAAAFGATVVGCRPSGGEDPSCIRVVRPDALAAELPGADVVVLAAPASAATAGLVDARFLAAMREGSILVNVSRGRLVDEVALLAALDAGRPGLALLDAFSDEPLPADSPWWDHPRVVVTPHNAGAGLGATQAALHEFAARLAAWPSVATRP